MTIEVETRAERNTAEHCPKFLFKYQQSFISVLLLDVRQDLSIKQFALRAVQYSQGPPATVLEAGRHRTLPIHH